MKEVLILDMDNTLADLFGEKDWLKILECGSVSQNFDLFYNLKPLISKEKLKQLCANYSETVIMSMVPTKQSFSHDIAVASAKVKWVKKNFSFIKNIIITTRINNKNLTDDSVIVYDNRYTKSMMKWKPRKCDTLCDDSDTLRETFIGKTMLPPWTIRN